MKTYKVLTITTFLILFCVLTTIFPVGRANKGVSIPGQRRTITVSRHKNPPIEIVSIDLAGQVLLPNTEFNAAEGWTENLRIKVKNNTEEPITQIEMILGIFPLTAPNVAALTAHYWFGKRSVESLPPNETVVLTHIGTKGDNNVPGAAKLSITSVIWNGDDSLKWDGGGIRRKVSGGQGTDEPPTYRADPLPDSKSKPKGLASP